MTDANATLATKRVGWKSKLSKIRRIQIGIVLMLAIIFIAPPAFGYTIIDLLLELLMTTIATMIGWVVVIAVDVGIDNLKKDKSHNQPQLTRKITLATLLGVFMFLGIGQWTASLSLASLKKEFRAEAQAQRDRKTSPRSRNLKKITQQRDARLKELGFVRIWGNWKTDAWVVKTRTASLYIFWPF
jgi:uncharacterized membrane protein